MKKTATKPNPKPKRKKTRHPAHRVPTKRLKPGITHDWLWPAAIILVSIMALLMWGGIFR